ncbi:hypothetical protein JOF56_005765 [Kibdelosporangium banguiense]|uniref:DUF3558 domain-containing protein n=1 Tax=Kibdelosporangium banguiense TaxID=1365924 RepID=A0ABS4TLV3_9PSEU|nr:DUF3558 domain-containing protein [Kibdelosporangium banguiense]MBP2325380.1 hypothetical protein [Kibdelosporangium banguiense]
MIARRRLIAAVCVVVFAGLLAACSDGGGAAPTSPASATTPPASNTTTSSAKLSAGVPSVRVPLDIKAFVAEPCKGITEPQKRALSEKGVVLQPGARDDRVSVPNCFFGDINYGQMGIYVALSYREGEGISAVYDKHAKGFLPGYWAPGEIAGYPVVYYSSNMSPTTCDVSIATSDTSYAGIRLDRFDRSVRLEPWETGSCAVLRPIAEAVLDTIRNQ